MWLDKVIKRTTLNRATVTAAVILTSSYESSTKDEEMLLIYEYHKLFCFK